MAPHIHIPPSAHTVEVSIIDTTTRMKFIQTNGFFTPAIKGHEILQSVPAYAFLIQHTTPTDGTRSLVFDLGVRKDWHNLAPALLGAIKATGWELEVPKDVSEILRDGGVDTDKIEAIIWSHHHVDHVGDSATFGPETALIIGPGVKENAFPGYPANPDSHLLESDYAGREVIELDFDGGDDGHGGSRFKTARIGQFRAVDYFGDGSFYLLDAPGHTVGHICGLARIGSGAQDAKDTFLLMGGDVFHHGGELRPSPYHPLPSDKTVDYKGVSCSCSLFKPLLPHGDDKRPFYVPAGSGNPEAPSWHHDSEAALRTIQKVQELDAQDNVFVVGAHDETILDTADFFPARVNASLAMEWADKTRWRFLADFAGATGEKSS